MKAGDIFYSPLFEFYDKKKSSKLVILLNDITIAHAGYFVCVTSKSNTYRSGGPGCHSQDGYYFLQKNCDWFDLDTWILFEIYEFTHDEIRIEASSGNLIPKASMRIDNFKALIRCIKHCPDIMKRRRALLPNY